MTATTPPRPLSTVFERMARLRFRQGWSVEEIHAAYPSHSVEKIRALQDRMRSPQ